MAEYRLCMARKAQVPYFIEAVSVNIYTIEELCFYLMDNLYLLDETLLNKGLLVWLKNELGLDQLASHLEKVLERDGAVSDLLIPIFQEIHYLSPLEIEEEKKKLRMMEDQPYFMRGKLKGDALMGHGKYGHALKIYEGLLDQMGQGGDHRQLKGAIYYNMGCAYGRLFQFPEAKAFLEKAWELLGYRDVLQSLCALRYLQDAGVEARDLAEEYECEEDLIRKILDEIQIEAKETLESLEISEEPVSEKDLRYLREDYHRATGY